MKVSGLRKRWFMNTVNVILALGSVCALAITAYFAAYYYSSMQSDLYFRAETTTEFFSGSLNQNYQEFYMSCMTYAENYEDRNHLELQFIDTEGNLVASSYGNLLGILSETTDIMGAVNSRAPAPSWVEIREPENGLWRYPAR